MNKVSLSELRRLLDEEQKLREVYSAAKGNADLMADLFEQHEVAVLRLSKALRPAMPALLTIAEAARPYLNFHRRDHKPYEDAADALNDDLMCDTLGDSLATALEGIEP